MPAVRRFCAALIVLGAAGCASDPGESQTRTAAAVTTGAIGTGIGRAAAIGTRYPWAFAGTGLVAGMAVGSAIGEYLDPPPSRMWAAATVEAAEAARPGRPIEWRLRDHHGRVTMIGDGWIDGGGRPCRALRQETGAEGRPPIQARDVIACRAGDGTWEVVPPPEKS